MTGHVCGACDGIDAHEEGCPVADALKRKKRKDDSVWNPAPPGQSYKKTFTIPKDEMEKLKKQAKYYANGHIDEFLEGSTEFLILGALIERKMISENIGGRSGPATRLSAIKHHEELINKIAIAAAKGELKPNDEED